MLGPCAKGAGLTTLAKKSRHQNTLLSWETDPAPKEIQNARKATIRPPPKVRVGCYLIDKSSNR